MNDAARMTRRDDLMRAQLEHPLHRHPGDAVTPVRAGKTGSGDQLLVLTWTAADLARECEAGVRLLGGAGLRAGMRVANTLPGALSTPGALLLGDVIEALGGLDIPLGVTETDAAAKQAWELVDRVEPAVLVLDPTTGERFMAMAPAIPRPWLQGIVWLRTDAPFTAPVVPAQVSGNVWQRTWLAIPEAACFVAASCEYGRFHVDAGVAAEVVDASTGLPRAAGELGHLVLTPRHGDTRLQRYLSGLAVRQPASACGCAAAGMVLEMGP